MIDKPAGWTSHDVVNKVRRLAGERSVGHLGTLDPIATGVLPLLLGAATRLARFYGAADKIYQARVRFGFATDTYDTEGQPAGEPQPVTLERDGLLHALAGFQGAIQQTPPRFSAKKVGGVAAYKLARKNKEVNLAPVTIQIHALHLLGLTATEAEIHVHCSSGTYIRTLAHDLGALLGCGAHLAGLRRLRSGDFSIEQARTLEQLAEDVPAALIPISELLPEFPVVVTDETTAAQIRHGRNFHTNPFRVPQTSRFVKALSPEGALIAIGEAVLPNLYHPIAVLN